MVTLHHKFINNSQHGFVKNKSCLNNLLVSRKALSGFLKRRDALTSVRILTASTTFWKRKLRKREIREFRNRVTTVELCDELHQLLVPSK